MHVAGLPAQAVVLGCRAVIAVLLLAAGGAKLADLPGFASAVRLFMPRNLPSALPRGLAGAVAVFELALGAGSLALPRVSWLGGGVLVICACFLAVSVAGFARHRGQPCRCFGGLSAGGFGAAGIIRAAGLTLAAGVATAGVPASAVALSAAARLGLLAAGVLVAGAAFSAAAATARSGGRPGASPGGRRAGPGWV